jgi:hypothetical protein
MVVSTSALMMALSMLVMDSKRASPAMVRMAEVMSMFYLPYWIGNDCTETILGRTSLCQGKKLKSLEAA